MMSSDNPVDLVGGNAQQEVALPIVTTESGTAAPVATTTESNTEQSTKKTLQWPKPLTEDFDDPEWPNLDDSDDQILDWVMRTKRLLVRTVTWNLCAKPPPAKEQLQSSLLAKRYSLTQHNYIMHVWQLI
jgi:hypothetical protein